MAKERRCQAVRLIVTAASLCGIAAAVHAQEVRPERPYRGLFASRPEPVDRGQTLDMKWSLLGAYDDNVTADSGANTLDPRFMVNGAYSTASAALEYAAHGEHVTFTADGGTTGRYYPGLESMTSLDPNGRLTVSADLSPRTRIEASQGLSYQPYYQLNLLTRLAPSDSAAIRTGDSALKTQPSQDYDGRFAVVENITGRSSVTLDYSYRQTRFDGGDNKFSWQLATAVFRHNLTKDLALRLGYGYGTARNAFGSISPEVVTQNIDAGVDYDRPLSFSRRTKLSFSTGSTFLTDRVGVTHYVATGQAALTHEIGRSWNAHVSYNRGVQFFAGFAEPLFADTVGAGVGGLVTRRISLSTSVGYSSGSLGIETNSSGYSTSTGLADLQIALTRMFSFDAQYAYYHYGFEDGVQVPLNLPLKLNRQGLRFGINGWLPLFARGRR